jgi:acyl carrier protein
MNKSEIQARVVKVVCQVLGVDPEMVQPDSHFVFDLGAESTQSVELIAAFEGEFNVEMDEESALGVKTVGDAVDFIAGYVR